MRRMKWIYFLCIINSLRVSAQKPALHYNDYKNWEKSIINPMISADGNAILYTIYDPDGNSDLVIKKAVGDRQTIFHNITSSVSLTEKNNTTIFKAGDTLYVFNLTRNAPDVFFTDVADFKYNGKGFIGYRSGLNKDAFTLWHLKSKISRSFKAVSDYHFSADGNYLFLNQEQDSDILLNTLICLNLRTMQSTLVQSGRHIRALATDSSGNCLVFISQGENETDEKIVHYLPGMKEPVTISLGTENEMLEMDTISPYFNKSGSGIVISMVDKDSLPEDLAAKEAGLRIWSYTDSLFQSEIKKTKPAVLLYYHVNTGQLMRVADKEEEIIGNCNGPYALVRKKFKSNRFWEPDLKADVFIVNLETGEKTKLPEIFCRYESDLFFSPTRKYVISYVPATRNYCAYETHTGKWHSISEQTTSKLYDNVIDRIIPKPFGVAGWADEDRILIYDQYDILQIDLQKREASRNLTNGFGRKSRHIFSIVEENRSGIVLHNGTALLTAFNREHKKNGFWSLSKKGDPVFCNMESYTYHIGRINSYGFEFPKGMKPLKAKKANRYLVRRESATDYPNLYTTSDFKTFVQQTYFAPEKAYNWLTTTLLTWEMTDGRISQGILYKPENFDSAKKYPVIFHYYQRKSDKLNEYLFPRISTASLDIPTYVSNGYLVFVPDIYYSFGKGNGEAALNAVASAAVYLKKFAFIDADRMGLQAHSHGGSQTNFIISHSNLFAAACEAAGTSDLISSYGQLTGYGASRQPGGETGFMGIGFGLGKTPWTAPELYIRNSPVFYIDRITTPLLIMHGNKDTGVPFEQSIEMFTGLRRARKAAWFLEYNNAGHFLAGKQALDYTIRMRQFFDHFLKGMAKPGWMK